jgi:hypothetical protein
VYQRELQTIFGASRQEFDEGSPCRTQSTGGFGGGGRGGRPATEATPKSDMMEELAQHQRKTGYYR